MSRYPEFDLQSVEGRPFLSEERKVNVSMLAGRPRSGASFADFLASLPNILAGNTLPLVANAIAAARRKQRAVVISCGGHVIKCGMAPMLIALMEQGFISALAVNGAVAIHDAELALFGATSENVDKGLQAGSFGMARETAAFYNHTLRKAEKEGLGAGEALGGELLAQNAPHADLSLLAQAHRVGVPITVHIAVGTDIVHTHPDASGAALGETSLRDFRILTAAMRTLSHGGVLMNLGSAVILPEVLLKAVAVLRNQDLHFSDFLGVDVDFSLQYRAHQQLVQRVEAIGGRGVQLVGHHEILIPLLAFAILEASAQGEAEAVDPAP